MGFLVYTVFFYNEDFKMKIIIDKNDVRKKQRHTWKIKPFTRIVEDSHKYNRSSMKKSTREILNEEDEVDE